MFTLPDGPLSLYLHIPMCKSRCSYCAFYSEPAAHWQGRREAYTERLIAEIEESGVAHRPLHTLYIGGGDPANLGCDNLDAILTVAQQGGAPDEVTIEVNPESFDRSLFPLFEKHLVTRLSMGIQTMDQKILRLLGRSATVEANRRALALAQEARRCHGIDLSIDLMAALPSQTIAGTLFDLDEVLSLCDVEHLSLYCLTVEEGTALARDVGEGRVDILDEDGQESFLRALWRGLADRGFEHYEISNFAKGGRYSRHNTVYWQLGDYLGLGSGAASTLGAIHLEQGQTLARYTEAEPLSGYECEETTSVERVEEYLMMGLRTMWGIDKGRFRSRYGIEFDRLFGNAIEHFDVNWYHNSEQFFSLTEDGWMVSDDILVRLVMEIPQSLDRS